MVSDSGSRSEFQGSEFLIFLLRIRICGGHVVTDPPNPDPQHRKINATIY
jgi:hypothetical protein